MAEKKKSSTKRTAPKRAGPKRAAPKVAASKRAAPKRAASKPPALKPAARKVPNPSGEAAEKEVAQLLAEYDGGEIDNAWDVISEVESLDGRLPKSSALRPRFDAMFLELTEICEESGAEPIAD